MKSSTSPRTKRRNLLVESLEDRKLLTAALHPFDLSTLDGNSGFRLDGAVWGGGAGRSISQLGDVNGDGFADIAIGAQHGAAGGNGAEGAAFVIFGTAAGMAAASGLDSLDGANGFEMRASYGGNWVGYAVAGAGDVNGDGFDDILVSDPFANGQSGLLFVVFGKAGGFDPLIDLATLDGSDGFRIESNVPLNRVGASLDGIGDFNGDGIDDIAIGNYRGNTHLVFGSQSGFPAVMQLNELDGTNGFAVSIPFNFNAAVSSAGDFNGDGLADLLIGTNNGDTTSSAYLIFGSASPMNSEFHVSELDGSNGFRFFGALSTGNSVSSGDFNGDGYDDLLVGNPQYPLWEDRGEAFVIFGSEDPLPAVLTPGDLDGVTGSRITQSIDPGKGIQNLGLTVSGVGDFNADGFDDFVIGSQVPNYPLTGGSYVVFGRPHGFGEEFDLSSLDGTSGFEIVGGLPSNAQYQHSAVGDFNGDGFADLMVSRPNATPSSSAGNAGAVYILYGSDVGAFRSDVTAELVDGVLRVRGDDSGNRIRVTPSGIEGLDGTLINGESTFDFAFSQQTVSEIEIITGKGADAVIVENLPIISNGFVFVKLNIDTGPGKDFVQLKGNPQQAHVIHTGAGDDHVIFDVVNLSSDFDLRTGGGDDRVEFSVSGTLGSRGTVRLGGGDDIVQWNLPLPTFVSPIDEIFFHGGPGFDRLYGATGLFDQVLSFEEEISSPPGSPEERNFYGGDVTAEVVQDPNVGRVLVIKGKDSRDHNLMLSSSSLGHVELGSTGFNASINGSTSPISFLGIDQVKVVLGSGRDTVIAQGLQLTGGLIVRTGLGDDVIQVTGGQIGRIRLDTGGGDDSVLIDGVSADKRSKFATGWGADQVTIVDSVFKRKLILEGGLDEDTLTLLGTNLFLKGLEHDFDQEWR